MTSSPIKRRPTSETDIRTLSLPDDRKTKSRSASPVKKQICLEDKTRTSSLDNKRTKSCSSSPTKRGQIPLERKTRPSLIDRNAKARSVSPIKTQIPLETNDEARNMKNETTPREQISGSAVRNERSPEQGHRASSKSKDEPMSYGMIPAVRKSDRAAKPSKVTPRGMKQTSKSDAATPSFHRPRASVVGLFGKRRQQKLLDSREEKVEPSVEVLVSSPKKSVEPKGTNIRKAPVAELQVVHQEKCAPTTQRVKVIRGTKQTPKSDAATPSFPRQASLGLFGKRRQEKMLASRKEKVEPSAEVLVSSPKKIVAPKRTNMRKAPPVAEVHFVHEEKRSPTTDKDDTSQRLPVFNCEGPLVNLMMQVEGVFKRIDDGMLC